MSARPSALSKSRGESKNRQSRGDWRFVFRAPAMPCAVPAFLNLLAQVGTYLVGSALPCCRLPHPLSTNPVPENRVLAQNAWGITYTAGSTYILTQKNQIDKLRSKPVTFGCRRPWPPWAAQLTLPQPLPGRGQAPVPPPAGTCGTPILRRRYPPPQYHLIRTLRAAV